MNLDDSTVDGLHASAIDCHYSSTLTASSSTCHFSVVSISATCRNGDPAPAGLVGQHAVPSLLVRGFSPHLNL